MIDNVCVAVNASLHDCVAFTFKHLLCVLVPASKRKVLAFSKCYILRYLINAPWSTCV